MINSNTYNYIDVLNNSAKPNHMMYKSFKTILLMSILQVISRRTSSLKSIWWTQWREMLYWNIM